MTEIFADTSGWGCLFDAAQTHHALAVNLYRNARLNHHKIITTNYVLTELVALLSSPLRFPRTQTIKLIKSLRDSPYIDILHIDLTTDQQSLDLFCQRPDKQWSLVDCSSFVVMQQRELHEALTTDHHFEQAGFTCLLKS